MTVSPLQTLVDGFLRYLKVGFPLMLLTVFLSMIYIYLRYLM